MLESENFTTLRHFTIQCDRKIEARRLDLVFIDKKKREVVIIDVAIPGDDRVKDKELEKLEKYQLLKDEIAKVWRMRKVIVVPVVIAALGAVSVNFKEYMKRTGVNVRLEVIQKTAIIIIIIIVIPLFTLGSIYSTNASEGEEMHETNNRKSSALTTRPRCLSR